MHYFERTLCDVLQEMRKAYETRNFSYLLGLIEEAQSMGSRMEGALEAQNNIQELEEIRSILKKQIKELKKEKASMA